MPDVTDNSPASVTVRLPWPDPGLSPNARLHYMAAARLKAAAKRDACYLTLAAMPRGGRTFATPLPMRWTFCPPDRRHRDRDNIIASCKAAADGIAQAIGMDDRHFVPTYHMGEPVRGGVVIVTFGGQE